MSRDGTPGCQCSTSRIDIAGICVVCRREKLHVLPKTPFVTSWLPDGTPAVDGDGETKAAAMTAERSLRNDRPGPRASLLGCYVVVCDKGDYQHDYIGVYDTLASARSRAKTHFNDTGELTDVFVLADPRAE